MERACRICTYASSHVNIRREWSVSVFSKIKSFEVQSIQVTCIIYVAKVRWFSRLSSSNLVSALGLVPPVFYPVRSRFRLNFIHLCVFFVCVHFHVCLTTASHAGDRRCTGCYVRCVSAAGGSCQCGHFVCAIFLYEIGKNKPESGKKKSYLWLYGLLCVQSCLCSAGKLDHSIVLLR